MQNETEFDAGSPGRDSASALDWSLGPATATTTAVWSIPSRQSAATTFLPGEDTHSRPAESLAELLEGERRSARLETIVWFALVATAAAEVGLVLFRLAAP